VVGKGHFVFFSTRISHIFSARSLGSFVLPLLPAIPNATPRRNQLQNYSQYSQSMVGQATSVVESNHEADEYAGMDVDFEEDFDIAIRNTYRHLPEQDPKDFILLEHLDGDDGRAMDGSFISSFAVYQCTHYGHPQYPFYSSLMSTPSTQRIFQWICIRSLPLISSRTAI